MTRSENQIANGSPTVHFEDMKLSIKRNATPEDIEAVPEFHNWQLIDGDLYITSRPTNDHALAITRLIMELGPFAKDPKGWVILFEVALRFGEQILIGDVSGWRRERMPVVPEGKYVELAPDWICEGLSPSAARLDRGRKREIYAKAGVGHLWFLDPLHHTIEVLALVNGAYQVVSSAGGDDRGRFPPFETVEIDLSVFWLR